MAPPPDHHPNATTITAFTDLDTGAPVDLVQMLHVVWAGKWVIALATALTIVAAGYYGFVLAGPRYAAVTLIDTTPATSATSGNTADTALAGTQIQVINATATLQQVIDHLKLADDPAFNRYLLAQNYWSVTAVRTRLRNLLQGRSEPPSDATEIAAKLVQNLRAAIRVDSLRDTAVLRITVTTGDPDRAMTIANTIAAVYLADRTTAKIRAAAASAAWVDAQTGQLRRTQVQTETALAALVAQAGLQDPARSDILGRQLLETTDRLSSAQAALARASGTPNRDRLTRQIAVLASSRDDLAAQVAHLARAQQTRDQLLRDLDANRAEQAAFQAHLQDMALRAGDTGPGAQVLNAATQAQYIGPQKILLLQIAACVGALGGLMVVIAQHSLRRGFADGSALHDATGLPVLAQLPLLASRRPARLLATLDAPGPSAVTEGFRHLRTAVLPPGDATVQVILSTSAIPGEGKTTQAIGLAHAIAMLGKRVLLVDADLRQGDFGRYFALTGTDGLAAVLLGHIGLADATQPSAIPGVDLLAGGAQDGQGSELLFLPALGDVLAQARARYDVIVIDAPPVLPVPDTLALAAFADRIVFAVRWEKTAARVVLAATTRLAAAGSPVTGLTLTQINARTQAQRGGISFVRYGRGYFQT